MANPSPPETRLPLEIIYLFIDFVFHRPTLATLCLVRRDFANICTPQLWKHLIIHSVTDLMTIIVVLRSKPNLAKFVQTVAFIRYDTETWDSAESLDDVACRVVGVREYLTSNTSETEYEDDELSNLAKQLPGSLLKVLKPPDESQLSFAISDETYCDWYRSFEGCESAPKRSIRLLCLEGGSHYTANFNRVEPKALHLYGSTFDWTLEEGPGDEATFLRFEKTELICFSIYTRTSSRHNVFDRCGEYQQANGSLRGIIVRIDRELIPRILEDFEATRWPSIKPLVRFCLWDPLRDVEYEDLAEKELEDGTWHAWMDDADALGQRLTPGELKELVENK